MKQLRNYNCFVKVLDVLESTDGAKNTIRCVFELCESTLFEKLAKRKKPLDVP